jgi:hypothetical protein
MEEGEFKKRIDKESDSDDASGFESVGTRELLKLIDEAKKEFPEVLLGSEMKKKYGAIDWVHAVNKWFVKWFGR